MTAPTATTPTNPADPPLPDLRVPVHDALRWVADLLAGVRPEQLTRPTPCTDFDVDALERHLFGVVGRLTAMGAGHPAESVPPTIVVLPDDVEGSYRARVVEAQRAWTDPVALGRLVEAPFGRVPGAVVLGVYLAENLTHGWDLATATGQDPEADPALAGPAYAVMQRALPAEGREDLPFGPPVEPAADAGPTERLANWLGRVSR